MSAKQFYIDGNGTGSIGIYISSQNVRNAPQIDFNVVEVVGRNGDLVKWNNRFANIELKFSCYTKELTSIEKLKTWLYSIKDYRRIESDYEPNIYREGYFPNALQIEPFYDGSHYHFDLTFNCKPQKWLKNVQNIEFVDGFVPPSITFEYYSRNEWMIAELLNTVTPVSRPNDDMFMVYKLNDFIRQNEYTNNMFIVNIPHGMDDNIFCGFIVQNSNGFMDSSGTTWIRGNDTLRCGTNTHTYNEYNNYYLIVQPNEYASGITLDVYGEESPGQEGGLIDTLTNIYDQTGQPVIVSNEYIGTSKPVFDLKFKNNATEYYSDYTNIGFAVDGEFVKIDFLDVNYLLRMTTNFELYEFETFDVIFDSETLDFTLKIDDINISINRCVEIVGNIEFESGSNTVAFYESADYQPKPSGMIISPKWWTL